MNKKIALFALAAVAVAPLAGLTMNNSAKAATLNNIDVTLSNTAVSGTTGVILTFAVQTALTPGTILEVSYDTLFTGGASLLNGDITVTSNDADLTASTESGMAAGYFQSALTITAATTVASGSTITISIDNAPGLTNPATAGNYSWTVTANIGGTGTTYDSGAGLASVADANQVIITATTPNVIALDLYNAGTNVLMTDPNTCVLGVLSPSAKKTCSHNVGVGTNSPTGATLRMVANAPLSNGSYTFAGATGVDFTPGTEAYGFHISAAGTKFTASGSYATAYQAVPDGADASEAVTIATSASTSDKTITAQHLTVTYAAMMSTATQAGNSYTSQSDYFAYTK